MSVGDNTFDVVQLLKSVVQQALQWLTFPWTEGCQEAPIQLACDSHICCFDGSDIHVASIFHIPGSGSRCTADVSES
mgnify:CR=1 FL=1